ncbi:MAG: hypothetical protein M1835_004910 [Candelina submexicana]|nr:MAG: hypothetical protein M1835_004910 [Candelina submexicana]
MDEIQLKHRKEQRDLQSQITQRKKSATKKTRKGVNDECAELERQLKERQAQELLAMGGAASTEEYPVQQHHALEPESAVEADEPPYVNGKLEAQQPLAGTLDSNQSSPPRKRNRQKARLARRAAEQEAVVAQATSEAPAGPTLREQERWIMLKEFDKYGLKEQEIRPDGHCMYSAVADQLMELGAELLPNVGDAMDGNGDRSNLADYRKVRMVAADFIGRHPDDFVHFLEEPLEEYTNKIRDTGEWGGQLELLALARSYGIEINVLQGDGRVEKIEPGEGTVKKKIWLGYYRHNFGLGEHYNSLRKAS